MFSSSTSPHHFPCSYRCLLALAAALFCMVMRAGAQQISGSGTVVPVAAVPLPSGDLIRYYRTARTDALYDVTGSYPFSPDIIKPQSRFSYYKFVYSTGKLARIECFRGSSLHVDEKYFEAVQVVFDRTASSLVETRYYLDAAGDPMRKDDGVYAERLTLNQKGQCIRITNLDAQDQPMVDRSGIVHYERELDDKGRVVSTTFQNAVGERCYDNEGHYEIRSAYNERDQRISKRNIGSDGTLQDDKSGVAVTRWKYDGAGNIIEESYYNKEDKPCFRNSFGPQRIAYTYDKDGNIIREEYFDPTGNHTTDEYHNVAEIIRKFDVNGNIVEVSFLDSEGFLSKSQVKGYAAERYTYNERGDPIERSTYNEHGRLIRDPALGAAIERIHYNGEGKIVSQHYFDEVDDPVELPLYNAAVVNYDYLKNGAVRTSFLDRNGLRCEHPIFGFSIMEQSGPPGGRLVFFDSQERRVSSLRVFLINPYVRLVCAARPAIYFNALFGTFGLVVGFFIAALFTLRGAVQAVRGKTFVPSRMERWLIAGGTGLLLIGYLLWLASVQYVQIVSLQHVQGAVREDPPFPASTYLTILLFLILYAYIIVRMLRSIRILNVERASVLHWIRHFLIDQGIPYEQRDGRFILTPSTAEIRLAYFAPTKHAFVFYPRVNPPKNFDYRKLRQHLRQCAWESYANGRCWLSAFANALAFAFFIASMQTASYFLIRLIRGYYGNFE